MVRREPKRDRRVSSQLSRRIALARVEAVGRAVEAERERRERERSDGPEVKRREKGPEWILMNRKEVE